MGLKNAGIRFNVEDYDIVADGPDTVRFLHRAEPQRNDRAALLALLTDCFIASPIASWRTNAAHYHQEDMLNFAGATWHVYGSSLNYELGSQLRKTDEPVFGALVQIVCDSIEPSPVLSLRQGRVFLLPAEAKAFHDATAPFFKSAATPRQVLAARAHVATFLDTQTSKNKRVMKVRAALE